MNSSTLAFTYPTRRRLDGEGCEWGLTTEPVIEPITVADAKNQCAVDVPDDNGLYDSYIIAARQAAEERMARGLLTQTWTLTLPRFADQIWLPMAAPLQSVTTIKYYDTNGVQQTLATSFYTVNTLSRPGSVVRAANTTWPTVQSDLLAAAVEITYVVGWTTAALVPERIKQGCRVYIGYCDLNRDGFTPRADQARQAAEACWNDIVTWKPPRYYAGWLDPAWNSQC